MTGAATISTADRRPRGLGGRRGFWRGPRELLRSSLRARFLVGMLAAIVVADLAIAVSFYYQQRQHSIAEETIAKGRQMHRLADFQFEVGQIASQRRALTGAGARALRASRRDYARTVVSASTTPAQLALLRQTAPQLNAFIAARVQLDRLSPGSPERARLQQLVIQRAAVLTATMARSHSLLDMRIDAADVRSRTRAQGATTAFVAGTAIATFAALALALLLANRISAPVLRLAHGARELAAGRLDHRLEVGSTDEIGALAAEFNRMAAQVEDAHGALERRVAARTRELDALAADRRKLLARLIAAQEDERTRIARELHDEAGQSLTALRLGVEAAELDLRAGRASSCATRLQALSEAASEAISELERLVLDLRPAQLDHLGLMATLRWYVRRFGAGSGIATELEIEGTARRLEPRVETALFRIVQEALTNVARHSGASHVRVVTRFARESVGVEVSDDGRGFDPQSGEVSPASVGLLGMREHAELVGGVLGVTSQPGRGTRVHAEIPTEAVVA